MIKLRPHQTKAGKMRKFGIQKRIWPIIMEWEERTRREHPKTEYLFHLDGQQLTVADLDRAFNATCEELGLHKVLTDANGDPIRYKRGALKYDRSLIRWHDTRRTATTAVSNIEGLNNNDIQQTVGLSDDTQRRYDKTKHALKVRDAQDRQDENLLPAVSTKGDKRTSLMELKSLHEAGLIDADLYKEEQRRILNAA